MICSPRQNHLSPPIGHDESAYLFLVATPAGLDAARVTDIFCACNLDVVVCRRLPPGAVPQIVEGADRGKVFAVVCVDLNGVLAGHGRGGRPPRALFKLTRKLARAARPETAGCWLDTAGDTLARAAALLGESADEIGAQVAGKYRRWRSPYPVLRRIPADNFRSKVEVIDMDGTPHVQKTFGDRYHDFLERELSARRELNDPRVAEVVAQGENHLIMRLFEEEHPWRPGWFRLHPVENARRIITFVEDVNRRGYSMIDWHPGCAVFDRREGIKFVDFEYFTRTRPADDFQESVDFIGAAGSDYAHPGRKSCGYDHFWRPVVGIDYPTLMHGSRAEIAVKRGLYLCLRHIPRNLLNGLDGIFRQARLMAWRPRRVAGYIRLC